VTALLLLAGIAHAGWTVDVVEDGCTFLRGAAENGVTPIRVECDWTDIPAADLHAFLARPENHDGFFTGLAEATLVDRDNGKTKIYQRFEAKGITDREVVVEYETEALPNGKRYGWTKSADQSSLKHDCVEVPTTTGKWEVEEKDGEVHVVYELRMLVGGMVPGFMMKWFQGGAIRQTLKDLKRGARG
jgi:hypothetical protein